MKQHRKNERTTTTTNATQIPNACLLPFFGVLNHICMENSSVDVTYFAIIEHENILVYAAYTRNEMRKIPNNNIIFISSTIVLFVTHNRLLLFCALLMLSGFSIFFSLPYILHFVSFSSMIAACARTAYAPHTVYILCIILVYFGKSNKQSTRNRINRFC